MSTLRKDELVPADDLAEGGQCLYEERLRELLEPTQSGRYVALSLPRARISSETQARKRCSKPRGCFPKPFSTWRVSGTLRPTPSAAMTISNGTN